jgi:hypothetical protein
VVVRALNRRVKVLEGRFSCPRCSWPREIPPHLLQVLENESPGITSVLIEVEITALRGELARRADNGDELAGQALSELEGD